MPAAILHVGALVTCSHAPGIAQAQASSPRVKVSGQHVVTIAHGWTIAGCGLSASSSTFCINGQFTQGAIHVRVDGNPVITMTSPSTVTETAQPMLPRTAQARVRAD